MLSHLSFHHSCILVSQVMGRVYTSQKFNMPSSGQANSSTSPAEQSGELPHQSNDSSAGAGATRQSSNSSTSPAEQSGAGATQQSNDSSAGAGATRQSNNTSTLPAERSGKVEARSQDATTKCLTVYASGGGEVHKRVPNQKHNHQPGD